jgi:hypothetical protein
VSERPAALLHVLAFTLQLRSSARHVRSFAVGVQAGQEGCCVRILGGSTDCVSVGRAVPFVANCGCNAWADDRKAATLRHATDQPVEFEPGQAGARLCAAVCQNGRAGGQRHRSLDLYGRVQ